MPKVSEEHLNARREQIVDAAVECFARNGFHQATMQDICREAGLSPGAVYRYFASKDEIVEAIADERHAREQGLMDRAQAAGGGAAGLRELGRAFFGSLAQPKDEVRQRLAVQLWAEAARNPRVRRLVMRGTSRPRAVTAALVREAQERGEIDPVVDPDAFARAMLALFQGLLLQRSWEKGIDNDAYLETVELMLDALIAVSFE